MLPSFRRLSAVTAGRTSVRLLALGLLALGALACNKDRDPEPVEEIMPLAVGNEWVYKVSYYDGNGDVYREARYARSVVKDTTINKSRWFVLSDRSIVQNHANGYVYFNRANNDGVIIYPNARHNGIGIGYQYPNYKLWVFTNRAEAQQPVLCNGTSYDARQYSMKYQYEYPGNPTPQIIKREEYVTQGVGMVRTDIYQRDSNMLDRKLELERYTLN
ncbi:hypothetical protein [Hymenobacter oligotrophus]|uniref:hypothetical protein n=1 Tax=Hymenobacter oligotrophus TaxID=2319843 RepID=UPI0013C2EC69|nr:hypothetical protein [Hymenobacter oligotrophus]